MPNNRKRRYAKPTKPEILVSNILTKLKIPFKREHYVGNYPVDFFLSQFNLSIQVDGAYFHGPCKECNSKSQLDPRQVFQKRRDLACLTFHRYNKINIVRLCDCLSELEIEKRLKKAIKKIRAGNLVTEDK